MTLRFGQHLLVLVALVVNLWVGGDFLHAWLGWGARLVFELVLILGYLTLVVGMRAPLPWHRRPRNAGGPRDDDAP